MGEPGCMQDPLGVVDTVQAASSDTVGAFQGTGAPLDKLHADSRRGPVVFHKRHTWAPVGSWPWGSAGHHKVSCPAAVFSGRGNSMST